jgi:hypothetical protein
MATKAFLRFQLPAQGKHQHRHASGIVNNRTMFRQTFNKTYLRESILYLARSARMVVLSPSSCSSFFEISGTSPSQKPFSDVVEAIQMAFITPEDHPPADGFPGILHLPLDPTSLYIVVRQGEVARAARRKRHWRQWESTRTRTPYSMRQRFPEKDFTSREIEYPDAKRVVRSIMDTSHLQDDSGFDEGIAVKGEEKSTRRQKYFANPAQQHQRGVQEVEPEYSTGLVALESDRDGSPRVFGHLQTATCMAMIRPSQKPKVVECGGQVSIRKLRI